MITKSLLLKKIVVMRCPPSGANRFLPKKSFQKTLKLFPERIMVRFILRRVETLWSVTGPFFKQKVPPT
jgi:hypothetical protein